MALLFERKVVLQVGRLGENGKSYEGLAVNFEILKTSDSKPNTAKVNIMNLNRDSRGQLEDKNLVMILKAGYGANIGTIFTGDITKASSMRQGKDWITTLESGDKEKTLKETKINKTFNPGTSTKDIISEVATTFDASIGTIKGLVADTFQNGVSFSGSAKKVMDDLTKKNGLEWSIQDGTLQILPPLEATSNTVGLLISPETGLIGTPIKREEKDKEKNQGVGGAGIEFVSLMAPSLLPGVRILLKSENFNGVYKIRKVTHKGDTMKGPFETHCEGIAII